MHEILFFLQLKKVFVSLLLLMILPSSCTYYSHFLATKIDSTEPKHCCVISTRLQLFIDSQILCFFCVNQFHCFLILFCDLVMGRLRKLTHKHKSMRFNSLTISTRLHFCCLCQFVLNLMNKRLILFDTQCENYNF